ncbi:MAG: transpeptidase family protein [Deltaproteobacteria bacterium]|nr:transpeptidase family protein [Deltaproteobacteria bacterium]
MPRFQTSGDETKRRQISRIFAIGGFFAVGFALLLGRAVWFHLADNEQLEKVAMRQYRTAVQESTKRGKILDASGREMAVNVQAESIYADPRYVKDPYYAANELARILHVPRQKLVQRLTSSRKFVWIKRLVGDEEVKTVKRLNLPGIFMMNENRRAYPNGSLASTVLGAVGFDAEALGGVELKYNDFLVSTSTPGQFKRDARGHLYLSPTDASDEQRLSEITLTIDKNLQYTVEHELETAVQKASAKGGVAVVVDPLSGEVLAMASTPSFDPNHYAKTDPQLWKNKAIADAYEPGSTFKVMVIAAALDAGTVTPETIYDCEQGKMQVGSKFVRDTHPYKKISVADIIKVSSNIGSAKIGKTLSEKEFYEAMRSFGLGSATGIALPGESGGIFPQPTTWSELQRVTMAFGQGVSATPLQMAMAFAAIANGGELLRPRILKRMITADGENIGVPGREVLARPIRPDTAKLMADLLKGVVKTGGTGTMAASMEYEVAGKTGTAQKVDPQRGGYASGKYYSSFIGFAPAEVPRVVVYVAIDEPAGNEYYGGQVAAPAFRKITEEALHSLKVPAQGSSDPLIAETLSPVEDGVPEELPITEVSEEGRQVRGMGNGKWRMPDFRGLTMRGVLAAMGPAEVDLQMHGSGVAVEQSPSPGTVISSGASCKIVFKPML